MKKIKNKLPIFSTDNFPLAIFLKTKGCKLLNIAKKDSKRAFFNFENSLSRQQLTNDFWMENGSVEPRAFYRTQKELKTLLYDNSYPST